MNKLSILDQQLIFELAKSSRGSLDSFSLFRKSNVTFPSFDASLQKLDNLELISIDGYSIHLTAKGIIKSQFIDLRRKDQKSKPNYNMDISETQIYIPSIKRLDKVTFAKILDLLS